jgi:selenocysteine-specific translation elongation factor
MSQVDEQNFVVGIFGDNFELRQLVGQSLGAPGTKSDLLFFNRLDSTLNHVFCAITPVDYPEKIKPFLQALSISNIHVLVIDLENGLNATIGEILVGLDLYHALFNTKVLAIIDGINSKTEWKLPEIKTKLMNILKTTSLDDTDIIEIKHKEDYEKLKMKIIELGSETVEINSINNSNTKVLIDHAFPVKGIGTVILGIVKEGEISAGQMLEIIGYEDINKKVIIRSIQKQDRVFKTAQVGDRVGLALKGNISPEDVDRNNIIASQGKFVNEEKVNAKVHINKFYVPNGGAVKPSDGIQYFGMVDLKISPLKFESGDEIKPGASGNVVIQFDKKLYHDGTGLKGIITELNKFNGKLRIIGYFQQII